MTRPFSQREFATDVVRDLQQAGFDALWAGGCVRDLLMGRNPSDYDVATNATPDEVRDLFGRRRTVPVGESFGVMLVLSLDARQHSVEVATFRTEGTYADGRRPSEVKFCTAEEDALRRDFTINGMFFDPVSETLLDYVGGEEDLGRGLVRAIGDPHLRMTEDKLRMLRAVRFTSTLDFELDEETRHAISQMVQQILVVSWERISQELQKMLIDQHRRRAMRLCEQLGLIDVLLPELEIGSSRGESLEWVHTLNVLDALENPSLELAMAVLLHTLPSGQPTQGRHDCEPGSAAAVCKRLKMSNRQRQQITWLVDNQSAFEQAEQLPLADLKRLLAHPLREELLALTRAAAMAENRSLASVEFIEDYLARTPAEVICPPELITGEDLIRIGLKPGRRFKSLLEAVREAQLSEEISTREEAVQLVERLLEEN